MRSTLLTPAIGGLVAGITLFAMSLFIPGLSPCIYAFFIVLLLMAAFSPLMSGPAFGGWIKASTTAIDGMNRGTRYRGKEGFAGKIGAVVFLGAGLLTYFLFGLFITIWLSG